MAVGASYNQQNALDVDRPDFNALTGQSLNQIRELSGCSLGTVLRSFAKLAWGRGKLSFADFVRLRLYDPAFGFESELNAFAGQRRNRDICVAVNYRHDWHGMLTNKVASLGYLAAYGFPTIPVRAIYAPEGARRGDLILADRSDLVRFLSSPEIYPLFGKPVEGLQSLGSIGLLSVSAANGALTRVDGKTISIAQLAEEIEAHYRSGYIFQSMARPHEKIAELCGQRLACVRLITALTESGPQILRGCWKIPAGENVADNYWRQGNLLARIDLSTGKILAVSSGSGVNLKMHETHPDTGVAMIGFQHPAWSEMKALALEGAMLMRHVPMIGWDLANTDTGPLIVEMNETPDFFLVQLADRRGIYDETFERFMAFQANKRSEFMKEARARIAKLST